MKMNIKRILVLGTAITVMAASSVFAAPAGSKAPSNKGSKPNIEQTQKGGRGDKQENLKAKKGDKGSKENKGTKHNKGQKPSGGNGQNKPAPQPRK